MSKQVPWNEDIYTEFSKLAMLSPLEREILRTRIMGMTITEQSEHFGLSESALNRCIKRLKQKYDNVQQYSDKLPERKSSAQETWQDNH